MKIFIGFLIAFTVTKSQAQQTEISIQKVNTVYLTKSKTQRATALILLTSGAASYGFGFYALDHTHDKNGYGVLFVFGGIGMAAASLPFFMSSGINKHKAKLQMKREVYKITPYPQNNISYTALCLRLDL